MTKLLSQLMPGLVPAGTFLSPRIATGILPSGTCFATDGSGGDGFVGGGKLPAAPKSTNGLTSIVARNQSSTTSPDASEDHEEYFNSLIKRMARGDVIADRPEDIPMKQACATNLGKLGDVRAIPHLIDAMNRSQPQLSDCAMVALAEIGEPVVEPLIAIYDQLNGIDAKERAVHVFGRVGDVRALPFVLRALDSMNSQNNVVIHAVSRMGEAALEPLIERLKSGNPLVRAWATISLGAIGDRRAVKPLIVVLQQDNFVRVPAAEALGAIGDEGAVDALVSTMNHEALPIGLREKAAEALGKIGDPRSVDALIRALDDPEDEVAAENALVAIGFDKAREELARALRGDDEEISIAVAAVLGSMGGSATELLFEALKDPRMAVRTAAVSLLGEVNDPRMVEPLSRLLEDPDVDVTVKTKVINALMKLNYEFTPEQLVYMLGEEREQVVRYAEEKLQALGEPAIELLLAAVVDPDGDASEQARRVLREGFSDRTVVPALTATWRGGDAAVRKRLRNLIFSIKGCEELLVEALGEKDLRKSAVRRLGELDYQAAVEPVAALLDNTPADVRLSAAETLLVFGDSRAEDALIDLLSDPEREIWTAAVRALGDIASDRSVEALIDLLEAEDRGEFEERAWKKDDLGNSIVGLVTYTANDTVLNNIPPSVGDRVAAGFLNRDPSLLQDRVFKLWGITRRKNLVETLKIITGARDEIEAERHREKELQERKEELGYQIERITNTIKDRIGEALGLKASLRASTSNGGGYGSVSMGIGLSMRQELRMEHRLELLPNNSLEIDEGESIEEAMERMRTLNFLVHHEMGHVIQTERKIPKPVVKLAWFAHLDHKQVVHDANEMVIDKLGFDAARNIYVHGDGDILLEEDQRESIAIRSYLTLARIVLRNHQNGTHELLPETLARVTAVLLELAKSKAILTRTKRVISALAEEIYNESVGERGDEYGAQIARLVNAYRRIFLKTKLPR